MRLKEQKAILQFPTEDKFNFTVAAAQGGFIEGWDAALDWASENAKAEQDHADFGTGEIWVNQQSILDGKDI